MADWLEHPPLALKVPGSKQLVRGIFKKKTFGHTPVNRYPNPFRAGEGEGR